MNKYEIIEKSRLYYLQPSYWRKVNRHCATCGLKWTKENKVNFGIAFELQKNYYHYKCLPSLDRTDNNVFNQK